MACCAGQVSWFSCYPAVCPSDGCCCDSNCSGICSQSSTCGAGACCACNTNNSGFAWVSSSASCNWAITCGQSLQFISESPTVCGTIASGWRVDTNGNSLRLADLTPALFTALGHSLTDGVFDATASTGNVSGCLC